MPRGPCQRRGPALNAARGSAVIANYPHFSAGRRKVMLKRVLPLFLVVVFLAACAAPAAPAPAQQPAAQAPAAATAPAAAPAAAGGTIKIGLEGPMTGDYAEEGKGFQNALTLLV